MRSKEAIRARNRHYEAQREKYVREGFYKQAEISKALRDELEWVLGESGDE